MSRFNISLMPIAAVALALLFQPCREFFFQTAVDFGLLDSSSLFSRCEVHDTTRDVTYRGLSSRGVQHFYEIFYGQDTSGSNRFAPPVKYEPPRGSIIDSTRPGAWCPQATGELFPFSSFITNISENCLSLRISRPANSKVGAKLPVLVWIHGGMHWSSI